MFLSTARRRPRPRLRTIISRRLDVDVLDLNLFNIPAKGFR